MPQLPFNIKDAQNNSYNAVKIIGEGSQGRTYLLEGGKHIAKLFFNKRSSETMRSTINYLINLGLSKKRYAVPLREVVSPECGYIAEFASGMMPLADLKWTSEKGTLTEWYIKTGGTQKRYAVLSNLAYVLRSLHSQGLTYCDLSPSNVFVSSNPESNAVFLIDMDNVRHKTGIATNIYTPFYGAPEVVSFKSANTPMSDSFSFAVMAYELLTMSHPLIGDYVSDGEPELEDKALKGEIPWINDSSDSINECTTGFGADMFLTDALMKLFHRMFEEGLNDPDKRPDMYEWYEAFCKSNNNLLRCPDCNIFYPYDSKHACTLCGRDPGKVAHIAMKCWNETGEKDSEGKDQYGVYERIWEDIVIDDNTPKVLNSEHFLCSDTEIPEKLLEVEVSDVRDGKPVITMTPVNGKEFFIYTQLGKVFERKPSFSVPISVSVNPTFPIDRKLMVTVKPLENKFQRVMTIE